MFVILDVNSFRINKNHSSVKGLLIQKNYQNYISISLSSSIHWLSPSFLISILSKLSTSQSNFFTLNPHQMSHLCLAFALVVHYEFTNPGDPCETLVELATKSSQPPGVLGGPVGRLANFYCFFITHIFYPLT